jgi:cytoskeletal protein CcmA (bactofilin family)
MIEGTLEADEVIIQGFVRGEVQARRRIHLASQGRVVGSLSAPQIAVDFGAYLEGSLKMDKTESPAS